MIDACGVGAGDGDGRVPDNRYSVNLLAIVHIQLHLLWNWLDDQAGSLVVAAMSKWSYVDFHTQC